MKTTDIRNECFESWTQKALRDLRLEIWNNLFIHGSGTTREVTERMGGRLEDYRPRITELHDMGFVQVVAKKKKEGIYQALSITTAREWFAREKQAAIDRQILLGI